MLKCYVTAARHLKRNRVHFVINTLGLSIGLAIGVIILNWVQFELNYDRFHRDHKRIYRLTAEDQGSISAAVSPAVKIDILENIPEIEKSVRIFDLGQFGERSSVMVDDQVFIGDKVFFADATFFDVFSFRLLKGNSKQAIQKPNGVVLTEQLAKKYFGSEDPMGKSLVLSGNKILEVTGVLANLPPQSHFHFDLLVSMKSHPWGEGIDEYDIGSSWRFHTYLKTFDGASPESILTKVNKIGTKLTAQLSPDYKIHFSLQRLSDIHLQSALTKELEPNNDVRFVYLFSAIGILVIVIACINYINLTTAFSTERAKESGIRKVLGAQRPQLVLQYLIESLIISGVALAIAATLIWLSQPVITSIINFETNNILQLFGFLVGLTAITGFGAGIIPAILLSSARPIQTLKGNTGLTSSKVGLRKLLVVFQFTVSLILLMATAVIYQQIQYLHNKHLGFDKNRIMVLYTGYQELNVLSLKNALLSDTRISHVTSTGSLPINIETTEFVNAINGKEQWFYYTSIDRDFFKTLDINLIKGKEEIDNITDKNHPNKYILNSAAVKAMGWNKNNALGREIIIHHGNMLPGKVIGVVGDFHFKSLHFPIFPLVLELSSNTQPYLLIKIEGNDAESAIEYVQSQWAKFAANLPFEYNFLDQEYDKMYQFEAKVGKLIMVFAFFATLIAMLGLFGLTSFTLFKRAKEISIRRVFGATQSDIAFHLSAYFARLIAIAFILSAPISYFLMKRQLGQFAYRVEVSPILIVLVGVLVLILAMVTMCYHSFKASKINPAITLKCE